MTNRQQQDAGVSLRPSEMSAGGALIDDADVTFKAPEFVLYDFEGKAPMRTCAKITLVTDDGEEHVEYLSAADPKHFAPSPDGTMCVPTGDKTTLNNNSKFALFVTSLINARFPESEVGAAITFLAGIRAHVKRKPVPKSWSSMGKREDGRETTVLEVTELLEALPAKGKGKAGAKVAAGASTAKGAAKKPTATDAIAEELTSFIEMALAEAGTGLAKKDLVMAIFRLAANSPNKKALTKLAFDDDFLMSGMAEGKWSFDGETVEAAE